MVALISGTYLDDVLFAVMLNAAHAIVGALQKVFREEREKRPGGRESDRDGECSRE